MTEFETKLLAIEMAKLELIVTQAENQYLYYNSQLTGVEYRNPYPAIRQSTELINEILDA